MTPPAPEVLDVTETAAVRVVVDEAFAAGRVDVIVSNAGYGLFGAAAELPPFGVGMTIVEPGGARTEFRYGSADGPRLAGSGLHPRRAAQADRRL